MNLENYFNEKIKKKSQFIELSFKALESLDHKIPGEKAFSHFIKSNLSKQNLAKIWEVSDFDKDGYLSKAEFYYMSLLVDARLEGHPIPDTCPKILINCVEETLFPKNLLPAEVRYEGLSQLFSREVLQPRNQGIEFKQTPVLSQEEQRSRDRFNTFEKFSDPYSGKVTCNVARELLLKTGLRKEILAQIWEDSDQDKDGQLSYKEFVRAFDLVEQYKSTCGLKFNDINNPQTKESRAEALLIKEQIPITFQPIPQQENKINYNLTQEINKVISNVKFQIEANNKQLNELNKNLQLKDNEIQLKVQKQSLNQQSADLQRKNELDLFQSKRDLFKTKSHMYRADSVNPNKLISCDIKKLNEISSSLENLTFDSSLFTKSEGKNTQIQDDSKFDLFREYPNRQESEKQPQLKSESSFVSLLETPMEIDVLNGKFAQNNSSRAPVQQNTVRQAPALIPRRSSSKKNLQPIQTKVVDFDKKPQNPQGKKKSIFSFRVSPDSKQSHQPKKENKEIKIGDIEALEDRRSECIIDSRPIQNSFESLNTYKAEDTNLHSPSNSSVTPGFALKFDSVDLSISDEEDNIEPIDPPLTVVALRDFKSPETDFYFEKNDLFKVTFKCEDTYYAEIGQYCDWFPSSYVTPYTKSPKDTAIPSLFKKSYTLDNYRIANYDFTAEEADEIPFKLNDILVDDEDLEEWCGGYSNGKIGIYPKEFTDKITQFTLKRIADVVSIYEPRYEYELKLNVGEKIGVINENSDGWIFGVKQNSDKAGFFPKSCIK